MSDATASAIEKLESFFAGLNDEERAAITPLIEGGIMGAISSVEAEVEGFTSAAHLQASPAFLNYLTQARAPKLAGLAGLNGFVPIMPM